MNRLPLLSNIKLCASFHHNMWIQTGVTVRKRLNEVMTSVTLTFDIWPWPFAWTSCLSMVITPENFRMIRWQKHCQKGVTDGQTARQTDRQAEISVLRAAWSQLKNYLFHSLYSTTCLDLIKVITMIFNDLTARAMIGGNDHCRPNLAKSRGTSSVKRKTGC